MVAQLRAAGQPRLLFRAAPVALLCAGLTLSCMAPRQALAARHASPAPVGAPETAPPPAAGAVWAWGLNDRGQLGIGSVQSAASPVEVSGLNRVVAIAAGLLFSLALTSDGAVWTWGANPTVIPGNAVSPSALHPRPIQVAGLRNIVAIAAGNFAAYAVKADGTVWAWGDNNQGQLGLPLDQSNRGTPVQVGGLAHVIAVSAGNGFALALEQDGTVWAWGANNQGQLGLDTGVTGFTNPTPIQVSGLADITAIAAGGEFGLALARDGTVWAWGNDWNGELGRGTLDWQHSGGLVAHPAPQPVQRLGTVVAIAAGYAFALALTHDGTVWSWGQAEAGLGTFSDLGTGSTEDTGTPSRVKLPGRAVAIAAGASDGLAITATGAVWEWGNVPASIIPVFVPRLHSVSAIAGGASFSLALVAAPPPAPISLTVTGPPELQPLVRDWANAYSSRQPTVALTYTALADDAGIAAWTRGSAALAVAGAPLTQDQMQAATTHCGTESRVAQAPVAVGSVALIYNLPRLGGRLTLTPDLVADLFLGHLRDWGDDSLRRDNPRLTLPHRLVHVIYRTDGGGTTAILTHYLAAASPDWAAHVSVGSTIRWPTGYRAIGDLGVIAQVLRISGAIGYVSLSDALAHHVSIAALRNPAGRAVVPSSAGALAAAQSAQSMAPLTSTALQPWIVNAPAPRAYPLAGYIYMDLCAGQPGATSQPVMGFVRDVLTAGAPMAQAYGEAPLPPRVQAQALAIL